MKLTSLHNLVSGVGGGGGGGKGTAVPAFFLHILKVFVTVF